MQPLQIIPHPVQASGISIYSYHIYLCQFQHMPRLSTRGAAGIQDSHTISNIQQGSRELRPIVLNRNFSIAEAGYFFYGYRFG
jgi:hypothetical protein